MADTNVAAKRAVRGTPLLNTLFAGFALLSDGYQAGAIGSVNTIFGIIYPNDYVGQFPSIISSMLFVGTIIGQLSFGYVSDVIGRKNGMVIATLIVILGAALSSAAYGADGNISGLFAALSVYRIILGIGVGAEYPCGSVAASESAEEANPKRRGLIFVMVTNFVIDFGFVLAAIVPTVLVKIFAPDGTDPHGLMIVWRFTLALGVVPPLSILYFRVKKLKDSGAYQTESMKRTGIPYGLIIKRYWKAMVGTSVAWFVYDFISYPFGIYSGQILTGLVPDGDLLKSFAWNILLNAFYLPGAVFGAYFTDTIGSKNCLMIGFVAQAVVGFILGGVYGPISGNIGAFVVVYGIFLMIGEAGPGDNLGLVASRIGPTAVRGQVYGVCAATGKIGAFVGSYAFKAIGKSFAARGLNANTGPFFIASAITIIAAVVVFILVPDFDKKSLADEDRDFRIYLAEHGFDTTLLGTGDIETVSSDTTDVKHDLDEKHDAAEKTQVVQ